MKFNRNNVGIEENFQVSTDDERQVMAKAHVAFGKVS
jgi:hypothetical protein